MYRRTGILLVCMLLVCALCASIAVAREQSPLRFGVKAGVNISDFRGNDIEGVGELIDWKTGFCGGVFASYAVNDWLSIQPELLYSMKGMKIGIFTENLLSFSLDYIEIPVLAKAKLPLKSRLQPFAFAGPILGFNVRSKLNALEEYEQDLSDFVSTTEFSLALGAGIRVAAVRREMQLEFRWVPGLTNIFNDDFRPDNETVPWKNDTFSFLLGIEL